VFLCGEVPGKNENSIKKSLLRGVVLEKNSHKEGLCGKFSVKKIIFRKKNPPGLAK
jgi:hypothetical protein